MLKALYTRERLIQQFKSDSRREWEQKAEAFVGAVNVWQREYGKHLEPMIVSAEQEINVAPGVPIPRVAEVENDDEEWLTVVEKACIVLPSSKECEKLVSTAALKGAVETEVKLRKRQANDSLGDVRTHLITSWTLLQQKLRTEGEEALT